MGRKCEFYVKRVVGVNENNTYISTYSFRRWIYVYPFFKSKAMQKITLNSQSGCDNIFRVLGVF